jgi:hypothetical protein
MKLTGNLSSISSRIRATLSGQEGIALLMVLVVITILTTLVVSFTDTTQKHLQVTQYYKNKLQAYWAAQSGLQAAVGLLKASALARQDFDGATSPWNFESDEYQMVVPLLLANIICESSMIQPALLLTDPNRGGRDLPLGRFPPAAPILDENRKLSLFGLIGGFGTAQEGTDQNRFDHLKYLFQYLLLETDFATEEESQDTGFSLGIEEKTRISIGQAADLTGYLVDWMDTENNRSATLNPDTAEQSCPADGLPYEAKNGRLDSIDEIGLVCGFRQLPRTTIELLTRHLTAYNLTTNINTATLPVLHAFCSPPPAGDGENETDSEDILELLHYGAEDEVPDVLQNDGAYRTVLENFDDTLVEYLITHTDVASTHFQVAIYGLVMNLETGTDLARTRLRMDLHRDGQNLTLLYYRED